MTFILILIESYVSYRVVYFFVNLLIVLYVRCIFVVIRSKIYTFFHTNTMLDLNHKINGKRGTHYICMLRFTLRFVIYKFIVYLTIVPPRNLRLLERLM